MTVLPVGERAVLVEVPDLAHVHRLWAALREKRPDGIEDAVAGARTVLLTLSARPDLNFLTSLLSNTRSGGGPMRAKRVEIPVVYDGPDLTAAAEAAGVDPSEVRALHSSPTYTVGFLGFSPGFAYLVGGDPRLAVGRLPSPRTSVPAGSLALAAGMTAVYPQSTPGGWRLIGRTDTVMFDPARAEPALLAPGDLVRFRPVNDLGPPALASLRTAVSRPVTGLDAIEVIDPGPLLTIQDGGRPGWGHAGVPVAGAADLGSALRAGRLAGNPPGSAVLEATLGGCRLRMRCARTVALTGADADITVDGLPARRDTALPLPAGSELAVGRCRHGVRVYIAVAGGIEVAQILGSRSTDTLSGLGPSPLQAGDLLPVGPPPSRPAGVGPLPAATPIPRRHAVLTIEGRWGPRHDWLSARGRATVEDQEFTVGASSDRTGVRLDGAPVELARSAEIPSEGMVSGAVQMPPAGRPIVLMRNHPATGGYPVVAVVDDSGVDALAQAGPGQRVRFAFRP